MSYLTTRAYGQFLLQVTCCYRCYHLGYTAYLAGKVGCHHVHRVCKVLPCTCHTFYFGLAAQFTFGTHFTSHTCYFECEGVELVHHGIDGVLQVKYFSFHIYRYLLREVTAGYSFCHFGYVAYLAGKVTCHLVHRVGQVFPCTRNTRHKCLTTQLTICTHLTCYAGYFRCEGTQLVHHCIQGFLQLQYFTAHIHGYLTRHIAVRHSYRHIGYITYLVGEVAGHLVHRIGKVFPCTRNPRYICLPAQLTFCTHFTGHTCYF